MPAAPIAPQILPLTPERLADFFAFFEGEAFGDNPAWSSCYCQCFYEDHREIKWSERSAAENKSCAVRRCGAGEMQGFLAYSDGKVVGWCNAGPRNLLHALDAEPIADAANVGCILCFLVSPSLRGKGIAKALLAGACAGLREQGLQWIEANPRPQAKSAAENHFGPLSMYLAAGFTVDRTDSDGSVWVRKSL